MVILHESTNDKYFLEWIRSLSQISIFLSTQQLIYGLWSFYRRSSTVFHLKIKFCCLIIIIKYYFYTRFLLKFVFLYRLLFIVYVIGDSIQEPNDQMIKWSCHLIGKLEILSININSHKYMWMFKVTNKESQTRTHSMDRTKVKVAETRFFGILEAFCDVSFFSRFSSVGFFFCVVYYHH